MNHPPVMNPRRVPERVHNSATVGALWYLIMVELTQVDSLRGADAELHETADVGLVVQEFFGDSLLPFGRAQGTSVVLKYPDRGSRVFVDVTTSREVPLVT